MKTAVLLMALLVGGFVLFGFKVIIAGLMLSSLGRVKKAEKYAYYDDADGSTASVQDRAELVARPSERRAGPGDPGK